ncbi:MAG: winged helix-turn-helix domain-containing protein [Candidatus Hadarchaeales archaeon]
MPKKGKRPAWEREENRTRIYLAILGKPSTFAELKKETGLAPSTLTLHLREMKASGIIEKAIENDRVVYRTVEDRAKMEDELLKLRLQSFLELVHRTNPELYEKMKALLDKWFEEAGKGEESLKEAVRYVLKKVGRE